MFRFPGWARANYAGMGKSLEAPGKTLEAPKPQSSDVGS